MGRWRPPQPKSSPYITPGGHARLKSEFEQLWRGRRPEVVKALAAAAAEGDRSENAEYQYRKKELREIDARLKYLTTRLQDLRIVEPPAAAPDRVVFGCWVELADEQDARRIYRIVGPDETDAARGWISVDSPVARAVLGKTPGTLVQVELPTGQAELEVMSVRLDDAAGSAAS